DVYQRQGYRSPQPPFLKGGTNSGFNPVETILVDIDGLYFLSNWELQAIKTSSFYDKNYHYFAV
ncbi:MAG: hypothetical protein AB4060_15195, partial [Crocosphaera sp.]